jgi:hypothetical protein
MAMSGFWGNYLRLTWLALSMMAMLCASPLYATSFSKSTYDSDAATHSNRQNTEDSDFSTAGEIYIKGQVVVSDPEQQVHAQFFQIPAHQLEQIKKIDLSSCILPVYNKHELSQAKPKSTLHLNYRLDQPLHAWYSMFIHRWLAHSNTRYISHYSPNTSSYSNYQSSAYLYHYTPTALDNKQLAQPPVAAYSIILSHRITNLPPPV